MMNCIVTDSPGPGKNPIETSFGDEHATMMIYVEAAMNCNGMAMCLDVINSSL